jgi:hypothetical protein
LDVKDVVPEEAVAMVSGGGAGSPRKTNRNFYRGSRRNVRGLFIRPTDDAMLTCGDIPSALLSILFEGGSVEGTHGAANGGAAVMAVSVTLQMEFDGVTVTISEAVLLAASWFSSGSACDSNSSTSIDSACIVPFA